MQGWHHAYVVRGTNDNIMKKDVFERRSNNRILALENVLNWLNYEVIHRLGF